MRRRGRRHRRQDQEVAHVQRVVRQHQDAPERFWPFDELKRPADSSTATSVVSSLSSSPGRSSHEAPETIRASGGRALARLPRSGDARVVVAATAIVTATQFWTDASAVLFVFDVADRSTFESLDRWVQEAKENGCDLSERSIKYSAGMGAPTVFVVAGNKDDQPDRRRQGAEAAAHAGAAQAPAPGSRRRPRPSAAASSPRAPA